MSFRLELICACLDKKYDNINIEAGETKNYLIDDINQYVTSSIALDSNEIIINDSFVILKNELVDYYETLASKYKNSFIYYEMPGEWNRITYITH